MSNRYEGEIERIAQATTPFAGEDRAREDMEHEALLKDIRAVLRLPAGLRFVCDLLDFTGEGAGSFTGNSKSYYLEGMRAVGLRIRALVEEADPELAMEIYRKRLERRQDEVNTNRWRTAHA
jgi:hypothetical protein